MCLGTEGGTVHHIFKNTLKWHYIMLQVLSRKYFSVSSSKHVVWYTTQIIILTLNLIQG